MDDGARVSLVTGSGRGIGRAIALELARSGSDVALVARSIRQLEETASLIETIGRKARVLPADVTDPDGATWVVREVLERLGPIDLLVNNAGSNNPSATGAIGPLWEINPEAWWHDVSVNLLGPFQFCRAVLPGMVERKSGRIVNIVSNSASRPAPFDSAYACSKAALVRLTDSLAVEVADYGISVFALSPGIVRTDLTDAISDSDSGNRWLGRQRAGHIYIDAEVPARAVVTLASGVADGLTGRFLRVTDDILDLADHSAEIMENDLYQLRYRNESGSTANL